MTKTLYIDADTILYSSAAQQQSNKCLVTNIEYGSQRLFESKTEFNNWLKITPNRTKDMYSFETISEITGEPRFAFQSIKQKVEKIVDAAGCDNFVVCIEGEGNFRKDYESKYVDYKAGRPDKPLLFEQCREYFVKKYKDNIIEAVGKETDDVVCTLAWESYRKALKTKEKGNANHVIAQVDKDIQANARGWLLNYNRLEDGVFWNDSFQQSYKFATQMLTGDNADAIPGIEKLSPITKERFGVKVAGVGDATAKKVLAECKTELDLANRVYECYSAAWEDDWYERLRDNGFFLYLLRSNKDKWDVDKYLKTGLK